MDTASGQASCVRRCRYPAARRRSRCHVQTWSSIQVGIFLLYRLWNYESLSLLYCPFPGLCHYSQETNRTTALIHGYDYRLIRFTPFEDDLKAQWAKPHAMLSFLENNSEYDFMVVMDADAVIHYPEIPFEWLMNRWGVTENTALAMAIDILDGGRNLDSKGRLVDNTGFMIARNIPRTHEILRSWLTCPYDEVEYPGCDVFKNA